MEENAMFDNPRYATRGVSNEVPLMLQIILWGLIDSMQVESKDYLQIFMLSVENGQQKIVHKQEQPEYSKELLIPLEKPISAKIYVIDDETHSTMLLAEEY
jgi:hypothetical protein